MAFHVFLFFLILCLAWLGQLSGFYHNPPNSRVGTIHTKIQRLLKPRTPLDCPAFCLSSTLLSGSGVGSSPLPVLSWCEVKSRRRAHMVTQMRSRLSISLPVTPLSALGATPPCTACPLSAGCNGADSASRRAGSFCCKACLRLPARHAHEPF